MVEQFDPGDLGRGISESRKSSMLTAALVIAAAAVSLGWLYLARGTTPADRTLTYPSDPSWSTAEVGLLHSYEGSGLTLTTPQCPFDEGAAVVAVNGVQIGDLAAEPDVTGAFLDRLGGHLHYTYASVDTGGTCTATAIVSPGEYPWAEVVQQHIGVFPLVGAMWFVGAFVYIRRRHDPAARTLLLLALLLPLGGPAFPFGTQVIDVISGPRMWPFLIAELCNAALWGAVLRFTTVFPRPLGPRFERWPLIAATFALPYALHELSVQLRAPEESGLWWWHIWPWADGDQSLEWWAVVSPISVEASYVVPPIAGAVVIVQWRRAKDPNDRRRVTWILAALLFCAVAYLTLARLPSQVLGNPLIPWSWVPLAFVFLPAVLGAAVLRYGTFDLQIVLRRSLIYALLPLATLSVSAVVVYALASLFEARSPLVWAFAGALVAALVYLTMGRTIERWVIALIFGARDDPYAVVSQLGSKLQSNVAADEVLDTVAETVARTLRLPYVAVELNASDGRVDTRRFGRPGSHLVAIPLTHQGEEVGRLILDTGNRREPFGPADRRLIEMLAHQVSSAAHGALLSGRLQRSLEHVVSVREEERVRLRNDMHDEVGPSLAAVRFQLAAAAVLIESEPDRAREMIARALAGQEQAQAAIRRIIVGLRPPELDQHGLLVALQNHLDLLAESGGGDGQLRVMLDASNLGTLSPALEMAIYRIVLEAVTNVAKHSHAASCTVNIRRKLGRIVVAVIDDGRGLPVRYRAGVGLGSMRERVLELGGTIVIASRKEGGTVVRAEMPAGQAT
jgi:signal transduction histidine kinase